MENRELEAQLMSGTLPLYLRGEAQQQKLDREFNDLCEDIEQFNLKLELNYYQPSSPRETAELHASIVRSLDNRWSFFGDDLVVMGTFTADAFYKDTYNFSAVPQKQQGMVTAESQGFDVNAEDGKPPRVALTFLKKLPEMYVGHTRIEPTAVIYADPAEVSLSYATKPKSEELLPYQLQLKEQLLVYDGLARLLLDDERSQFFRLTHSQQRRALTSIQEPASRACVLPGGPAQISAHVPEVYLRMNESPYGFKTVPQSPYRPYSLFGSLDSAAFINQALVDTRRITSRDELIEPDSGLCVVIRTEPDRSDKRLEPHQFAYIPVRQLNQDTYYLDSSAS